MHSDHAAYARLVEQLKSRQLSSSHRSISVAAGLKDFIVKDNDSDSDIDLCCVCMDAPISAMLAPCKHAVLCHKCLGSIQRYDKKVSDNHSC